MSHKAIESVAIQPHNIEAARVDTLMPEQLRANASSFLNLLTEYYNYMNIDGIVNGLNIITGGSVGGEELQYDDLNASDTRLGIIVTGFVPSTYNQTYVKLTDDEILAGAYPATQVYRGLSNDSYVIMKVDTKNSRELFRDTWVMASIIENNITVDFYDKNWLSKNPNGSNSDNLEIIVFREHLNQDETAGGTLFYSDPSKTSAAFTEGNINPIAMTEGDIPVQTSLINFTDIPTRGGHGQDLTVDLVVDAGKVVSIVQNKPGFGYRMDDSIILDNKILEGTIYSVAEVIASPSNVVRRILDEHDIDKTTEDYLSRIAKEIAASIPEAANLDRNYLYKKIVEYYSTRGSQDSIQSFFKIFFDVPASVTYPKDVLFKPSDGEYRGSSAVSESLEKYFYKKGYDDARRIHFYKKVEYDSVDKGTYFIDFEFGSSFKRDATAPASITQSQNRNAYTQTPLFSGQFVNAPELSHLSMANVGVAIKINSSGDLNIAGRFGHYNNHFSVTYNNYVSGTNEFPFSDIANGGRKRVRLAISVDVSESSGFQTGDVKVSMTNSGETDNAPIDDTSSKMTISANEKSNTITLYPGAIGQTRFGGGVGALNFVPDNQNPDGEYYVTTFAFLNRLATDDELKNFVNGSNIPTTNKIVDIDFDNKGSVNFTNKNSQVLLAKQIQGIITNGTGEANTTTSPLIETNYGLSSTGSEYPRRISWRGVKGFLSNEIKLHDSDYYQEFSYVIRTGLSVDRWQTEYQKLIHPAGLKFFTALYLELASRRQDQPEPPNIDLSQGIQQWLPAIQETVDLGSHSPKWQPGWLEYLFNVLLEIILYEQYSYRALLLQPGFNRLEDISYDHNSNLRIKQFSPGTESNTTDTIDNSSGFTLSGNTKNALISNINSISYDEKYITLDGNGTGIKTEGKIDKSSTLELAFKLLESGSVADGKYVAGCNYRGQDGHDREISIKQIKNNGTKRRVEVLVTDNAAQATAAQKLPLTSFRVIGTQNDVNTQEHGVFFSDTSVAQNNTPAGQATSSKDHTYNQANRGHNLIVFDPSAKTYEAYAFDTYGESFSAALSANRALVTKIKDYDSTKILIVYTQDASSCFTDAGAIRHYIAENSLTTSDGSSDSTSSWIRRRTSHVMVIRRGSGSDKDLIYEKIEDKDLSVNNNGLDANRIFQPVELSFQYDTSGNLIRGPHIGIRQNSISQPVIGGVPLVLECNSTIPGTNPLGYTKLKISANGQIEQYDYSSSSWEIKRSELEASDPRYLNELNLSGYDWEYLTETFKSTNNATFGDGPTAPSGKGGSSGYYYDENGDPNQQITAGLVTTGGPRWIRIKTNTVIDPAATYHLRIDVRNISNKPVNFKIGHIGLDGINGNIVSSDSFGDGANIITGVTLSSGSFTSGRSRIASFGGYNPPNDTFTNQSGASAKKFDPNATHFDLFIISNDFDYSAEDPVIHEAFFLTDPKQKALIIKGIQLFKTGGNGIIENHNITKVDPNFGFKKITTSSLPIVPKRFSVAANNLTFPNTLAIGTLNAWTGGNSNPKLAGVHELDRSSDLADDKLKEQKLLPLRAGKLSNFNPLADTTREWQFIQTTTGQVQRIYSTGPFGDKEVVYAANPDSDVSGSAEIGFNSGTIDITNTKDYRFSCFYKVTGSGTNTQFKFGFHGVNDSRTQLTSIGRKKQLITETTLPATISNPVFNFFNEFGQNAFPSESGKWYYIQGYVTGNIGNTNGNPNRNSMKRYIDAGIYDIETGVKFPSAFIDEFLISSGAITRLELSVLLNDNGDGFTNQGFEVTRMRIDEVGSAGYPSVSDLLQVNERSRFNSNLQVSEIFLDGEKENSIKHLITETDQVGNTFDRITADSPNHNPIPATETSTTYTPVSYTGAKEESITLKDIMSGGGGNAKLLSVTGIKSFGGVDGSHRQTNEMTTLFNSGERFSLMSNDLDANLTSSTRDFTIVNSAGADKTSEVSGVELEVVFAKASDQRLTRFRIIRQGIGLDEFDVITIPKAKLGLAATANDVKLRVKDVGKGTFTLEQNSLSNTNDNKMYLTRASNDSPSTLGIGGGFITDKFEWEKDKAYEITFNATKIFDRNTPANLYIGADKIGYFSNLQSVAGGSVNSATGNPNALLDGRANNQDGDGPQEFIFDSSVEGRCRIFFFASDVEGSWRLAHNGHQLRVDNTNSDQISRMRVPDDYWNRGTTKLDKVSEDNETAPNADKVISDSAALFVFESEFLNIGENIIQLYCLGGDGISDTGYIYVQPADNGLITEGANTHKIYMPNTGDGRIVIDHKIDRDVSRTFPGGATSMVNKAQEDEKLYEYNWKLENIKVREKRKRVYNGNFRCVVADPASGVFTGGDNTDPLFGTPSYRPVDVSTPAATDGAIGFGGTLIVPALIDRDSDGGADVGQEHTTGTINGVAQSSLPVLGVPKGKYGALRLDASNLGLHYISIGDNYTGSPFTANGLFVAGETYEISGYVFIPSTNSKIEQVHVMAGINPKATDALGGFLLDASGDPTFSNPIGENQILTGELAGYDAYSTTKTVISNRVDYLLTTLSGSGSGTGAELTIRKTNTTYTINSIQSGGSDFVENETITIPGTSLGGATTTNDATITITAVSESGGITSATITGTGVSTKGSWQFFKHTFVGPAYIDDEFPVIRFIGTLKAEALRGFDGYTGDATGEYFYIKNVVIKEGFDTDAIKGKNSFDNSEKSFIDIKDNVEYDLALNPPATNREACVAIDLKHPSTTNSYNIKFNNGSDLGTFNLNTIPLRDSNLLSSYLPFTTINTATNTPVTGQPLGYYDGSFITLGNPQSGGHSTFQSTLENEIIVGESPFGGSERIWRAKNKDGAWAQLSTIAVNVAGTGYQVTYSDVDNTLYSQPTQTYTNSGSGVAQSSTSGSGTSSSFNVTKSTTGYSATLVAGGSNHAGPIQYNNPNYTSITADDNADNAQFNVRRVGALYEVDIVAGGTLYTVGDNITIAGNDLGGTVTTHDLTIDITEVDSSGAITKITSSGNGLFNGNQGDTITINGDNLGGTTTANDLLIKVTSVDPSGAILSFTVSGNPAMINDKFQVIRKGSTYAVTQSTTGTGYTLTNSQLPIALTITGDKLGGATTTNDLTINITAQTAGIASTITSSGTADNVYDNVPIEDTQSNAKGVGALASLTINNSGVVQSLVVTNGGISYGRNTSGGAFITTGIPVRILSTSTYFSSGSGFTGTAAMHASNVGGALSLGSDNKPISLADGGFRTPFVNVDPSRTYRCSVWIRQSDVRYGKGVVPFLLTDGGHKRFRWTGHNNAGTVLPAINITGQNESTEPSFVEDFDVGQTSTTQSSIAGNKSNENRWFLLVGHIRPFDHTGITDHPDSGIYLPTKDGQKTKALTSSNTLGDWKFSAAMKKIRTTAIQIANPLSEEHPVDFYAPRIDELNGLEPTIAELTSGLSKYKLREEDTEKKLQLINWNTPINDVTESIGDYNHTIEGDDFNISIDEIVNNIEYADAINSTFDLTTAPKSTLLEIEIPASGGAANSDVIILPFQKLDSISPATHAISIDWGDGTSDFVNGSRSNGLYHKYTQTASIQRFTIKVQGTFNKLDVSNISSSAPASAVTGITAAQLTAGRNNFRTHIRKVYLGSSQLGPSPSSPGLNFLNCTGLTHFITVKGITNTSQLTKFEKTFKGCSNLKHIDVRGIDTSNATSLAEMFQLGGEIQARSNGTAFGGTTTFNLDLDSVGTGTISNTLSDPLSSLEVGMRIYIQNTTTADITTIDSIQSQSSSNVQLTLTSFRSITDNKILRFVKPVTGVKMIGLHTFDISSLVNNTNKGMNHMLRGVTINSDEVSRCIVAWANNTYGTSPSAASSAANSAKLRFDFGTSKFFTGPELDANNNFSSTAIVSAALTTLTGTNNWLPSTNFGDKLVTAETGSDDTFDF